jgi:hypothetical protein
MFFIYSRFLTFIFTIGLVTGVIVNADRTANEDFPENRSFVDGLNGRPTGNLDDCLKDLLSKTRYAQSYSNRQIVEDGLPYLRTCSGNTVLSNNSLLQERVAGIRSRILMAGATCSKTGNLWECDGNGRTYASLTECLGLCYITTMGPSDPIRKPRRPAAL